MPPSALNLSVPRLAARGATVALAVAAMLAGCSQPSEVATPPSPAGSATTAAPVRSPSRSNPPTPNSRVSSSQVRVFAEVTAVPCQGYPTGEQVIALLRRTSVLPGTGTVTVRTGPLCAGTWQYTVVLVPDRDPLQVVSKGPPHALELVAAGTDVCTVDVRAVAPAGIRAVTRC